MSSETDLAAKLQQLWSPSADKRAAAAQYLATLGEQPFAGLSLILAVDDPDEQVREWVTAALEGIGPPLVEDVKALGRLLGSESPSKIYWAATLLGRLGGGAVAARNALEQVVMTHTDRSVAKRAAWALERIAS